MTGKLYIDGVDIYLLYGIFVTQNGYNELIAYPPLKTVESNDWQEDDGIEVDLSAPALDTRELTIRFAYHGNIGKFNSFIELLSDGAYHDFNFADIGRIYRLRLVSQSNMSRTCDLHVLALRFADDFPLSGYSYVAPLSSLVPLKSYKIDEKNLSEYGVRILKGTDDEIAKSSEVKKNLLRNIKSENGVLYDGENVTFQTKDVKLNCLMMAGNLVEFWRNYNALLYDLVRPKERVLYANGKEYSCYYKSCNVVDFSPVGKIWFHFSLVLVFTNFRV